MAVTDGTTRFPKATAAADVLYSGTCAIKGIHWNGATIAAADALTLADKNGVVFFDTIQVTAKAPTHVVYNVPIYVDTPTVSVIGHGTVQLDLA